MPTKTPGRTLTTVRCRARGHAIARLVARSGDGHRVLEFPRLAAAVIDERRPNGVRLSNKLGGAVVDLDDPDNFLGNASITVACACGSDFHLSASLVLPRRRRDGRTVPAPEVILLDPT